MQQITAPQVTTSHITMSQGGRVVIPAEFREQLHVKQGDQLIAEIQGDSLVLTSKARRIEQMRQEILAGMPRIAKGRSLANELIAERRAEATKD
jgi:AbrB family looped-hinge helix DNA binding protein